MVQRVRLAALLFACSAPVSQLPIGMDPSLSGAVQVRGLIALALLLAFDDFGTGYASLAYLRSLPVHQVKIDRSFVTATEDAPAGADDVARAVLLVGQTLGLETIAEGVELSEQATALETAGVQIAPGLPVCPADGRRRVSGVGGGGRARRYVLIRSG